MSSWDSAAPAAISGLVTAAQTVTLDGLAYDSLFVAAEANKETIVVAGSASSNPPAEQQYIEQKFSAPGYSTAQEGDFTVWSEIAVLNADKDVSAARTRCYAILRDWARAIADDPTLGGAVDHAWVSEASCRAVQTPSNGAVVTLLVGVDCLEFIEA